MRRVAIALCILVGLAGAASLAIVGVGIYRHGRNDQTAARVSSLGRICAVARPTFVTELALGAAMRQLGYENPERYAHYLLATGDPLEVVIVRDAPGRIGYAVIAYDRRAWLKLSVRPLAERVRGAQWVLLDEKWLRTQERGRNHDWPAMPEGIKRILDGA